jgi:hypothetical protein
MTSHANEHPLASSLSIAENFHIPVNIIDSNTPIPSRLPLSIAYWTDTLHVSEDFAHKITHGWPLPWLNNTPPTPFTIHGENPSFTPDEEKFMWKFAQKLKHQGTISASPTCPKAVLSAFLREKKDNLPGEEKGMRFLVNGSPLSPHFDVDTFRLEDLPNLVSQLKPDTKYTGIKLDLKDAYFCLKVPKQDSEYLGFALRDPETGLKHYFTFNTLCQGTKPSSYIFDRLLKPILKSLRFRSPRGTCIIIYVDDICVLCLDYESAIITRDIIIDTLIKAGFIINFKKCLLDPTQLFIALGFTLDFRNLPATISPSPQRRDTTIMSISNILTSTPDNTTPRILCSTGGKISSMRVALGSDVNLHLRHLYTFICSLVKGKKGWDIALTIDIPLEVVEELTYWLHRLENILLCTRPIWPPKLPLPQRQVFMDASNKAVAALTRSLTHLPTALQNIESISNLLPPRIEDFLFTTDGTMKSSLNSQYDYIIAVQDLVLHEQEASSCARELYSLYFLLLCSAHEWKNTTMQVFTDAKSILPILKKGSSSRLCHSLAIRINHLKTYHNIHIQYIWIPRELNQGADLASRQVDIDDYQLQDHALANILHRFNLPYPSHDLFATTKNKKCQTFFSRYFQIGTAGINLFDQDINGLYSLAFPPVSLITKFLNYLLQFQGVTIVILPIWHGSSFWDILCPDDHIHTAPFIRGFHRLTSHTSPKPDITMGEIGRPEFLTHSNSRHTYEWAAFLINTLPNANKRIHKGQTFCLHKHFGRHCPTCP